MSQLQAMVRPALEKIKSEITRTFEYYKGQSGESTISKIILTGGSASTRNLKQYISDALGVPVIVPELEFKLDQRFSGALGAAMGGTEKINLLPSELKDAWKPLFNRFAKPRVLVPIFLSFLLLLYTRVLLQELTSEAEQCTSSAGIRQWII